jgi:hypothetical protein
VAAGLLGELPAGVGAGELGGASEVAEAPDVDGDAEALAEDGPTCAVGAALLLAAAPEDAVAGEAGAPETGALEPAAPDGAAGAAGPLPCPLDVVVRSPIVVPVLLDPPTSADTGRCPRNSTTVITAIAATNTATEESATTVHRRRPDRPRRGSSRAGTDRPPAARPAAADGGAAGTRIVARVVGACPRSVVVGRSAPRTSVAVRSVEPPPRSAVRRRSLVRRSDSL